MQVCFFVLQGTMRGKKVNKSGLVIWCQAFPLSYPIKEGKERQAAKDRENISRKKFLDIFFQHVPRYHNRWLPKKLAASSSFYLLTNSNNYVTL